VGKMRKMSLNVLVAFIILFLSACNQTTQQKEADPNIPNNFVLRPEIELTNTQFSAGTAFVLSVFDDANPVIVTALHIFGPNGGLEKDIPTEELKNLIKQIKLTDAFSDYHCGIVTEVLEIKDAKPLTKNDIAAFRISRNCDVTALKMCKNEPKVGDSLWLVASVYDGAPKSRRIHKARVVEVENSLIYFEYENNELSLQATSGAPIVNKNNEVVGINLSVQSNENRLIGIASSSKAFGKLLKDAID